MSSKNKQSRIKKIGVDIDNVLSDTYKSILTKFNKHFDKSILYEEITEFHYLQKKSGIDKEKVDMFIYQLLDQEEHALEFDIFDKAGNVLKKWIKRGDIVHYITARPEKNRQITKKWLEKHDLMFPKMKLDLMDYDAWQSDVEYKNSVIKREELEYLIEDSIEIAEGSQVSVLLLDRPWNRGSVSSHVTRVKNWQDIDSLIG